jgi:hypothetical protein
MNVIRSIFGKLFNLPAESMPHVTEWHLQFRSWNAVGWVLFLATLFGVLAFLSYRRAGHHVRTVPRYLLAATRTLFLLLLLALLLRPVIRFTLEGSVRRAMLVLIDSSQSMVTPEKRLEDADLKRAAIVKGVLDPTKGLAQPADKAQLAKFESVTRLDLMKAALTNEKLDLLGRLSKDYDIRPFTFGSATNDISIKPKPGEDKADVPTGVALGQAIASKLTAEAPITPLGDAIKDLLGRSRGQPLAGIFIMTDGQGNSGSPATAAAELARQTNVPLYIYGVGIAQPKDIALASIFSQDICFVDDEVPVTVRLRSTNLAGRTSKVSLKLGDDVVDTKDVDLADDGEQVATMTFTPKKPGVYDLSATAEAQPEEANRSNNTDSKKIRVIDDKIKVLLIEQYPRWEFKYLQALLTRDRRVTLHTYLAEADPVLATLPNSQYVKQIPAGKADLIDKYDLVIIGDIDPRIMSASQLNDLSDFVNKFGGGLIVIPGRRYGPGSWRGTPMEKLLPIEVDTTRRTLRGSDMTDVNDRPIKLEVTPLGFASPMLRLSDKAEESKQIWSKLPPIYWDATVSRAKPGASVLVVDPDPAKATRSGKMPVIAMQQYGLGQVLYVGTDNTWRWRKNAADKYHATLWGQMVQRMSLPHLLGESKLTQLSSDKKKYSTGDKVTIYARLYSAGTFEPVQEKTVSASYQASSGRAPVPVALRPLPEQPGLYRGEFVAPEAGTYQFSVDRDPKEKLAINVSEPRLEFGETALNEGMLKEIAATTKGGYFREEDLYKMPDSTQLKTERVKSKLEVDIWSSPAYFLLLLIIVTAEWIGRKVVQLR